MAKKEMPEREERGGEAKCQREKQNSRERRERERETKPDVRGKERR
jgi:hypothetical protein